MRDRDRPVSNSRLAQPGRGRATRANALLVSSTSQISSWLPWAPAKRRPNQRAAGEMVGRPSARTLGKVMRNELRHGEE